MFSLIIDLVAFLLLNFKCNLKKMCSEQILKLFTMKNLETFLSFPAQIDFSL